MLTSITSLLALANHAAYIANSVGLAALITGVHAPQ
jgi:hypothetical protein